MVFKVDTNYSSWRRKWQPTLIFLPGKSRGQRNLVGYSPWGHKESVTTEHMSTNYSSLSLPYVYAACHILGTVAVFIVYFYIDDSVERAGPFQFSSIQLLSCVRLFATSWIAARQASLSITNSRSSLRFTSIESVMPSSHLIPLSSPSPPALNPSQHQSFSQWVNSSHEVSKVLQLQL